jgi:hypothetical protein
MAVFPEQAGPPPIGVPEHRGGTADAPDLGALPIPWPLNVTIGFVHRDMPDAGSGDVFW